MAIRGVYVENFLSFRARTDFLIQDGQPLKFFVGENGTGKTNIIRILNVLSQNEHSSYLAKDPTFFPEPFANALLAVEIELMPEDCQLLQEHLALLIYLTSSPKRDIQNILNFIHQKQLFKTVTFGFIGSGEKTQLDTFILSANLLFLFGWEREIKDIGVADWKTKSTSELIDSFARATKKGYMGNLNHNLQQQDYTKVKTQPELYQLCQSLEKRLQDNNIVDNFWNNRIQQLIYNIVQRQWAILSEDRGLLSTFQGNAPSGHIITDLSNGVNLATLRSRLFTIQLSAYNVYQELKTTFSRLVDEAFDFNVALSAKCKHGVKLHVAVNPAIELELVIVDKKLDKKFFIPQAPSGIIEILLVLVTLLDPSVKTAIFDEPGKNLHPSYQSRLRDLIIQQSNTKTIIVNTHAAELISEKTLKYCQRVFKKDGWTTLTESILTKSDDLKFVVDPRIRPILFARGAIFVEGEHDFRFLTALNHALSTLQHPQLPTLSRFIWDIVPCGGKENTPRAIKMARKLHLPYIVLLDWDAALPPKSTKNGPLDWSKCADCPAGKILQQIEVVVPSYHEASNDSSPNENKLWEELIEVKELWLWSPRSKDLEGVSGKNKKFWKCNVIGQLEEEIQKLINADVGNIREVINLLLKLKRLDGIM